MLVLYDAAAQPTVDFKTLRQSMAAAVRQALENNGHRGEGLWGVVRECWGKNIFFWWAFSCSDFGVPYNQFYG